MSMASAFRAPACSALAASTSGRHTSAPGRIPAASSVRSAALAARPHARQLRLQVAQASNRLFDDDDDDLDASEDDGYVATEAGERVEPYRPEYPNKLFVQETLEAFPDAGIATVEQARALFSDGGYTYLDVRPALEWEDVGKVKGSVNIGLMNSTRRYDPEQKKKVVTKSPNPDFVKQVEKRFPKKDTKLLIGCSNGTQYSIDALEALDEAGYENIVGLKGGYYAWFSVFDNKLGRRRNGEYAETYTHDGDSCGIHSSGAGFDRSDKIEAWVPPEY